MPGFDRLPRRTVLVSALAAAAAASTGCGVLTGPIRQTMDVRYDDRACPGTLAPVLLVLLPGANMTADELEREGFVAAVRERRLAVDVQIADASLAYVIDGSVLQHLHADVIAPARAAGYQRIWLAGISLGGYVALAYAQQHPGSIEGLLLTAPYLGRRPLVQAIVDAGGPAAWRRTAQPRDANDIDHALWMWLSALPADAPPIWLGYGSEDRFAESHRLLATLLPEARVRSAPGGHDWPPWRALWAQWLGAGLLPSNCSA